MNEDRLYTQSQLERYEDMARKNTRMVALREGYANGYRAGVVMGVFGMLALSLLLVMILT